MDGTAPRTPASRRRRCRTCRRRCGSAPSVPALAPRQEARLTSRREPHAVAQEDRSPVAEVDLRQRDALGPDVVPDVQLGPVRQGKHAHVFARPVPPVVQPPQLRPLPARVPLAEVVAQRENPFLGPGLLLVAAAAEHGVEPVDLDGPRQRQGSAVDCGSRRDVPSARRRRCRTGRRRPAAARRSGPPCGRGIPVSPGNCARCPCNKGNGIGAGVKALPARRSITVESLPPENSSAGRSNSAATSRRMCTDSVQRGHFAQGTALVRIAAVRSRAVPPVLLGHGLLGNDRDQHDRVGRGHRVPGSHGLREVAGVETEHVHAGRPGRPAGPRRPRRPAPSGTPTSGPPSWPSTRARCRTR
jgi:hypothetical protein